MIVTRQKSFEDILKQVDKGPVFLIGCSECATICHTGGEEEIIQMKMNLEQKKIIVSGWIVLDPACHLQNNKRLLKTHHDELLQAKKIIVFACGNGIQTVQELVQDADVITGTETLFLGEIKHTNEFEKRCIQCGECVVDNYSGLCPVSRCPKSMLNGPCGGAKNGRCEVDEDLECIWDLVYKQLKLKGRLAQLKTIQKPKDWQKATQTRRIVSHDSSQ